MSQVNGAAGPAYPPQPDNIDPNETFVVSVIPGEGIQATRRELSVVAQVLGGLPYKIASPILENLQAQVQAQVNHRAQQRAEALRALAEGMPPAPGAEPGPAAGDPPAPPAAPQPKVRTPKGSKAS